MIRRREDSYGFCLKDGIKVHLFISTAPCGDGSIFSPKDETESSDTHRNRLSRSVLRAKIEGGEGSIPVCRRKYDAERSPILTWDGVLQGNQRMRFMSCSDKICTWNVLGIQGSLLSPFFEPIYLDSVILGNLFCFEHIVRALHGRLNLNCKLVPPYKLQKTKVAKFSLAEKKFERELPNKSPNYAVNWIEGEDSVELIFYDTGKSKEGKPSRLSERTLFDNFIRLLEKSVPTLASCTLNVPQVYRDAKNDATDYQRAKVLVIQSFLEQGYGSWIHVPTEIDLFEISSESDSSQKRLTIGQHCTKCGLNDCISRFKLEIEELTKKRRSTNKSHV